jgi:hypothetical protein
VKFPVSQKQINYVRRATAQSAVGKHFIVPIQCLSEDIIEFQARAAAAAKLNRQQSKN